ncbi:hypothetical protein O3P69_018691 [Scylla paramamosain]|uniref:Uncharacterized protein n=1 Tax=Scylla paramamosain TaxID=85552 RepID=A0AAW0SSJ8_SCYPA
MDVENLMGGGSSRDLVVSGRARIRSLKPNSDTRRLQLTKSASPVFSRVYHVPAQLTRKTDRDTCGQRNNEWRGTMSRTHAEQEDAMNAGRKGI